MLAVCWGGLGRAEGLKGSVHLGRKAVDETALVCRWGKAE